MGLSIAQYDKIMRDYEDKQLASRNDLEKRLSLIYRQLPQLQVIDDTIAALSVQKLRNRLLDDDKSAISSYSEEMHTLLKEKQNLLEANGYTSEDLSPKFTCPLCKDTGYIENQKCQCFKKATVELLYMQSNLLGILKKENFEHFNIGLYSKNHIDPQTKRSSFETIQNALDTCHNFIDTFGSDTHNLFIYGDTGVGKTFLTNCVAKELITKSFSVIYFSSPELFSVLAKSYFEKDIEAKDVDEHIYDCDLLIIDDLGTELTNSFVSSQLFTCINERYARNKSTIISTNLSLEILRDIYSERIFSRITSNYTLIKLVGDDIRIKKKLLNLED